MDAFLPAIFRRLLCSRRALRRAQARCHQAESALQAVNAELKASQERLGLAQQVALVGTFEWDLETDTGSWTPELEALHGLKQGAFGGTIVDWLALVHKDDCEVVSKAFGDCRICDILDAEWRISRPDGTVRWLAGRGRVLSDAESARRRVVGANIDITERRLIEQALRESEEKFRTLAENANAAFGIVQGTRFVYANRYFAELSGYTIEEILSMDFVDMVHPDFRPMMIERARRRQMGEAVPTHYEFLMITKSGVPRWIDFSPAAMMLNGKPAIIGTGFDVTKRREMESELRQAKDAAEQANRSKDDFFAVLSHELRTPLTPVVAAMALLKRRANLGPQEQELIDVVSRNVSLETRLIDDLLDLTRIAKGKIELDFKAVDMASVIHHAIAICQPDIEARRHHLRMAIPSDALWLKGDQARLHQVIWNLVKNAVKFTPSGGYIDVRCFALGDALVIEVEDSGVGFEPESAERIFESFEQGGQGVRRQFGGLGLGLAISKRLVEMHGGVITAHSRGKGCGALFHIELPLAIPAPGEHSRPIKSESHEQGPGVKILLVDDNHDTASVMATALGTMGHDVMTAGDASAALDLTRDHDFDLLISDIGLPDRSGLELLKDLRASGRQIKAIALSGFGREEDIENSRQAGFAEHLTKPVDPNVLNDAVRRAR